MYTASPKSARKSTLAKTNQAKVDELTAKEIKEKTRQILLDEYLTLNEVYRFRKPGNWLTMPTSKFWFEVAALNRGIALQRITALECEKEEYNAIASSTALPSTIQVDPYFGYDHKFLEYPALYGPGYDLIWLDTMGQLSLKLLRSIYYLAQHSKHLYHHAWASNKPALVAITATCTRGLGDRPLIGPLFGFHKNEDFYQIPPRGGHLYTAQTVTAYLNQYGQSTQTHFIPLRQLSYVGGGEFAMILLIYAATHSQPKHYMISALEKVS